MVVGLLYSLVRLLVGAIATSRRDQAQPVAQELGVGSSLGLVEELPQ